MSVNNSCKNFDHKLDLDLFSDDCKGIVKEYICHICEGVLNHPVWNESCQHVFCKECLISQSNTNIIKCPQCLEEGISSTFDINTQIKPVYVLISLLEKQIINCKNKCGWKSHVKELKGHVPLCPKLKIICDIQGCNLEIFRDEKSNHESLCEYRIVGCDKCNENFINKNENLHAAECLFSLVSCPNNCGEEITRKQLDSHIKFTCGNILMSCEFETVGCKEKFLKKNEDDHMTNFSEYHNDLFLKFIRETKISIENKINSYDSFLNEIKDKLSFFEQQNKIISESEAKRTETNVNKFLNRKQKRENKNLNQVEIDDSENKTYKETREKNKQAATNVFELIKKENFYATNGIKIKKENEFFSFSNMSLNYVNSSNTHEFLLINHKLNTKDNINFKFRFEVKQENLKNWFAIGVIVKELLLQNDLKIKQNFLEADHGFFGISSEGVLFHNNSSYKNNSKLQNFPNFNKFNNSTNYSTFRLEYEYEKKIMKISIDEEFKIKIDMVFPIPPNMTCMPCLIVKTKFEESKVYFE